MESGNEVLMVLANYDFNDDEYEYTRKIFTDNGIGVKIAAAEHGECTSVTDKNVETDINLENADMDNFQAVVFIGGPGVDDYFNDENALTLVKNFYEANKIVAAICWAPVILAKAGILAQKKATSWEGAKADMVAAGVIFTGEKVTVDGKIITADGAESASDFGQAIVGAINSKTV